MCDIYVQEFIPFSHHSGVVSLEYWMRRKQDIFHLHPFGCVAYAQVPAELMASKLDPQSIKYILIRYYGHGAYKLFDSVMGAVIKTQNVIFEEGPSHLTLQQPLADFFPEPIPGTPALSLSDLHCISHPCLPIAL